MANLSVIIPCYNNGKLLAEMLDCCLRQTYSDWEVIIVDDGSTDDTSSIVSEYVQKDARIQYHTRERSPKGSVVCRNIGFELSSGKYIIHFDADDLISDTCFEKRVAFMDANPQLDYASFPAVSYMDGDELPKRTPLPSDFGVRKGDKPLLYYFLRADYPFSVWCNIYKRDSIKYIAWDERVQIYTDFSYIVPCILQGLRHDFCKMDEFDYFYRQFRKGTNMCSSFTSPQKCTSTIYLFTKTFKQIQEVYPTDRTPIREFIGFHILHAERLMDSKVDDHLIAFFEYMKAHYSSWTIARLRLVYWACKRFANRKLYKGVQYLMFFILFQRGTYMKSILTNILATLSKL